MHKFWEILKKILKAYFISVGIGMTLLFVLLIFTVWRLSSQWSQAPYSYEVAKSVEFDQGLIEIPIEGMLYEPLFEQGDFYSFFSMFGSMDRTNLSTVKNVLEQAKQDQKVKGVVLKLGQYEGGLATLQRLRQMLLGFNKPIYIWSPNLETRDFFLAQASQALFLPESGNIFLAGPVLQLPYYAKALEKFGVRFHIYKAGKFKSAFEGLTQMQPSPAVVTMYNSLLDSLYLSMTRGGDGLSPILDTEPPQVEGGDAEAPVVQKRLRVTQFDIAKTDEWFRQSLFTPQEAYDDGLIQGLAYEAEFYDWVLKEHQLESVEKNMIGYRQYRTSGSAAEPAVVGSGKEKIAILPLVGPVLMNAQDPYGQEIVWKDVVDSIDWLKEQEDLKSVLLYVNSPGGSPTSADLIWQKIQELKQRVPVVAYFSDVAASGGYYIGVAADEIISEPVSITGSIGVIAAIPDLEKAGNKWGFKTYTFTKSDRRNLFNLTDAPDQNDEAVLENMIESTYQQFLQRVSEGRKMPVEDVHELAQGRVYTGIQAQELGLIDSTEGFEYALRRVKELGGLNPDAKYPLARRQEGRSVLEKCLSSMTHAFRCLRFLDQNSLAGSPENLLKPWSMVHPGKFSESLFRFLKNTRKPEALYYFMEPTLF